MRGEKRENFFPHFRTFPPDFFRRSPPVPKFSLLFLRMQSRPFVPPRCPHLSCLGAGRQENAERGRKRGRKAVKHFMPPPLYLRIEFAGAAISPFLFRLGEGKNGWGREGGETERSAAAALVLRLLFFFSSSLPRSFRLELTLLLPLSPALPFAVN